MNSTSKREMRKPYTMYYIHILCFC